MVGMCFKFSANMRLFGFEHGWVCALTTKKRLVLFLLLVVVGFRSLQAYGLASDPDDGADINEDVLDWNGEFQV